MARSRQRRRSRPLPYDSRVPGEPALPQRRRRRLHRREPRAPRRVRGRLGGGCRRLRSRRRTRPLSRHGGDKPPPQERLVARQPLARGAARGHVLEPGGDRRAGADRGRRGGADPGDLGWLGLRRPGRAGGRLRPRGQRAHRHARGAMAERLPLGHARPGDQLITLVEDPASAGVAVAEGAPPAVYALHIGRPNPFAQVVAIGYDVPRRVRSSSRCTTWPGGSCARSSAGSGPSPGAIGSCGTAGTAAAALFRRAFTSAGSRRAPSPRPGSSCWSDKACRGFRSALAI